MPNSKLPNLSSDENILKNEITRLNKIIQSLMDRAERSTSVQNTDFSLFQTAIILEEKVQTRTKELETALHENEKILRALSQSEKKFRGLVNQSLVGICIIENEKFSYSNSKFDNIFGYSSDEIRELGPLDLAAESDRPLVAEKLFQRLSGRLKKVKYIIKGVRKNGAVIDVEIQSTVMDIDEQLVMLSLVVDITERARAEREVQALQKRLIEQSTHDALTGLYNRRYLDESLERELILAKRYDHPVSVIMGDLDHFKTVNDRYGHLAGDKVLHIFGELMKKHARSSDIYCRYGGEEFLLVLPRMTKEKAVERAEQLRKDIAADQIQYGSKSITVTSSFGVATFPADGLSSDTLISAADEALYAAKNAGRNRVNAGTPIKL